MDKTTSSNKTTSLLAQCAIASLLIFATLQSVSGSPQPQQQGGNNNSPTRNPYAKSPRDQPCRTNQECDQLFPNSWCKTGSFCECQKEHIEYEGRCLPVVPVNGDATTQPCEVSAQCAGDLTKCNEETKKCECFDTKSNGRNSTAFWRNVCYIKTGLGQHCDISEECKASISPPEDVNCDVNTRKCICKDGKTCEDLKGGVSPNSNTFPALTLILSGFMAIKVFY
jgi:hypothetical protein